MRGRVAVFIHQPKASIQSANGIMQALGPDYEFKVFTRHQVEEEFFDNVDMVAFPGGIGDADSFDYLLRENLPRLLRFINEGGRYLGICMGAYWAGKHYFNILDGADSVQYIKRPRTTIRRSYSTTTPIKWYNRNERMYFYDGCTFVGNKNKFTTVATYPNGDPAAIIQGRIGLIGPHPESASYWYDKKYLKPHWHEYRHHKLLRQFANRLMSQ